MPDEVNDIGDDDDTEFSIFGMSKSDLGLIGMRAVAATVLMTAFQVLAKKAKAAIDAKTTYVEVIEVEVVEDEATED